jgi:endonuclease/exonuclease/phosphatase family metal-dependent hydrolase
MKSVNCWILVLICAESFLLNACWSGNVSRASGSVGDREGQAIKVMTYNIHHANPSLRPGVIDVNEIARVIRSVDPDLVALQEVDVNTERSGPLNQAGEIASKLDMHFYFAKAIDYQGGEYGVAILSRFPLTETRIHRLPSQEGTGGEPRIMATAKVRLPNGVDIRFGSTHLDAQREPLNRQLQIREVANVSEKENLPFILAGDFNATPDSDVMKYLDKSFQSTCDKCPLTSSAQNPVRTIDHIVIRDPSGKIAVRNHRVPDEKKASDHLPVVAELQVKK